MYIPLVYHTYIYIYICPRPFWLKQIACITLPCLLIIYQAGGATGTRLTRALDTYWLEVWGRRGGDDPGRSLRARVGGRLPGVALAPPPNENPCGPVVLFLRGQAS
jgi:hypothetical protein